MEALKYGNSENRSWAAYALRGILHDIRPRVKEAGVLALIRVLDDCDPKVHVAAVKALGEIGPDAKQAVPMLSRVLKYCRDRKWRFEESLITALGGIGRDASEATEQCHRSAAVGVLPGPRDSSNSKTGGQECNRASPGGQYVHRKGDPAPAVATPSIQSTNFMGKIVR